MLIYLLWGYKFLNFRLYLLSIKHPSSKYFKLLKFIKIHLFSPLIIDKRKRHTIPLATTAKRKKVCLTFGLNILRFPKTCILILNFDPETVYNRGTNLMLFPVFCCGRLRNRLWEVISVKGLQSFNIKGNGFFTFVQYLLLRLILPLFYESSNK